MKWEYKQIIGEGEVNEVMMNKLGEQGWELVSIFPVLYTTANKEKAVFKRKKE